MEGKTRVHTPVLLRQVLELLDLRAGQMVVDGTVGAAGHAARMLELVSPGGFLLGLDRDPDAAILAREALGRTGFVEKEQFEVVVARFSRIDEVLEERGLKGFDRMLLDIGVNSLHLDRAERGFSLKRDGPLDMRMNPQEPESRSAAEVVASEDEATLARIFDRYGEERFARKVAREIVRGRVDEPIVRTAQLREVVAKAIPRRFWPDTIDPATRVFQALRIEVNGELAELEEVLKKLPGMMKPGSRAGIISFHSLEDRLVKTAFRSWCVGCTCPPELPVCMCGNRARFRDVTRKAVVADAAEMQDNPRSRSAKLRVVERLAD